MRSSGGWRVAFSVSVFFSCFSVLRFVFLFFVFRFLVFCFKFHRKKYFLLFALHCFLKNFLPQNFRVMYLRLHAAFYLYIYFFMARARESNDSRSLALISGPRWPVVIEAGVLAKSTTAARPCARRRSAGSDRRVGQMRLRSSVWGTRTTGFPNRKQHK